MFSSVSEPDPHCFWKLDPDPHKSQNSGAFEAQHGAVEGRDAHNGGMEAFASFTVNVAAHDVPVAVASAVADVIAAVGVPLFSGFCWRSCYCWRP